MVKVTTPQDISSGVKFLIFIFKTNYIRHEGDERSRTNPGHGYPAYTETVKSADIYTVTDELSLQEELQKLYKEDKNRKDIIVLKIDRVIPVEVSIKVDLGILGIY